jgi:His/Glu/Gln/Arg/opine family amino acid ABC transporter permease subunit
MTEIPAYIAIIAYGIPTTFFIAIACFGLGALFGLIIVVARLSGVTMLSRTASTYVSIVRAIPPITWLFIIFYGLPQLGLRFSSFPAAIIGLSLICSAYIAEIYRAGWNGLAPGQLEACNALGLSRFSAFSRVIGPQVVVIILPMAVTYFIAVLKNSAVVSVIGVSDITERALTLSRSAPNPFDVFIAAGAVYMLVSVPVGLLGRFVGPWVSRKVGVA